MLPSRQLLHIVIVLAAFVAPAFPGRYTWGHPSRNWRQPDDKTSPEFQDSPTSVTSLPGQTVLLECRVKNLGDKVVSWIRTRDLHILTSGVHTFTSDARFEVRHKPEIDAWTLSIAAARRRDAGRYECQVNTDPKINFAVNLTVSESAVSEVANDAAIGSTKEAYDPTSPVSTTSILGPNEQYVRLGSTVTFTCLVKAPFPRQRPPKSMDWFHGGRLVTFQAARGGISLDAEKSDAEATSKLTVAVVTHADAGNYTCQPSEMRPATVNLIIIEGEHTEAMQRDVSSSEPPSCRGRHLVMLVCVWWTLR